MTARLDFLLLKVHNLPYWRLSSVYFFNCVVLGLVLPYWGLYLDSLGQTSSEIGISSALLLLSNIVAPFFWQKLNHRVKNSIKVIRLGIVLAFICSFSLFEINSFVATSLFIFALSFCWQGINPLVESLTLSHLGTFSHHYGQIRLWGSIGFVVSVSSLGLALDYFSIGNFPLMLTFFMLLMLISTQTVPNRDYVEKPTESINYFNIIKRSGSAGLFVAIFLSQISQGAYIGFFSLYLQEHGIGLEMTGNLWSVAVIAEVIMFLFAYGLIAKLGADKLLILSLAATAVRWLLIAFFVELLPVLILAQLFHAFTYSATHSSVLELIRQQFSDQHQERGIVIYCTLCLGGGTAIGSVVSGYIWASNPANTFIFSATIAGLSVLIAGWWINKRDCSIRLID
ncbi:MFS transporter [Aliiglaciecola sp. LCG003]|uniref:MFS transporter n=1 Tax=Aliiglaciecola sp. LCG003 TaxID=3053655 RepID=UPI0025735E83|nr:MFS transporter [Aliiglaciecola sp. LCG003]WJG08966.1 MFS transporter [Aliiglaciecola sp. LCG003]